MNTLMLVMLVMGIIAVALLVLTVVFFVRGQTRKGEKWALRRKLDYFNLLNEEVAATEKTVVVEKTTPEGKTTTTTKEDRSLNENRLDKVILNQDKLKTLWEKADETKVDGSKEWLKNAMWAALFAATMIALAIVIIAVINNYHSGATASVTTAVPAPTLVQSNTQLTDVPDPTPTTPLAVNMRDLVISETSSAVYQQPAPPKLEEDYEIWDELELKPGEWSRFSREVTAGYFWQYAWETTDSTLKVSFKDGTETTWTKGKGKPVEDYGSKNALAKFRHKDGGKVTLLIKETR